MKGSSANVFNTSLNDFKVDEKMPRNVERKETTKDHREEKENSAATPRMNAFQFMMGSRHKTIGSNSPGREIDFNVSPDGLLSKQELKTRKSRFERWAEEKGASKRKREYEEIGNCINHKLEKRKKRLRRLLNIDSHSDDEVVRKRRKKKCVMIETDSENSNDGVDGNVNDRKEDCEKSVKEIDHVKLTRSTVRGWKFKIKLSMDNNKGIEDENVESALEKHTAVIEENGATDDEKFTERKAVVEKRVLRTRTCKTKACGDIIELDSDEEHTFKSQKQSEVKVAPVFLKAVQKPKVDPKVSEARRQFLLSGVPSSLKKEVERQQSSETIYFDVFPIVSHVQQKSSHTFWNLPKAELALKHQEIKQITIPSFSRDVLALETVDENYSLKQFPPDKIKNCKKIIKEIKSQNPDFPVYRVFNSIYANSGDSVEKPPQGVEAKTPKRRGRSKKKILEEKPKAVAAPEVKNDNTIMWTEKYKPRGSTDIIGNYGSVTLLKEWLSNWCKDWRANKKKHDSDTEFEITDDSCDSTKAHGNTIILKGPTGSGKTAAVYAVCTEFGFNVLEVNASSRRTGKRVLQDLQEATQSHQVCKKSPFVKEEKEKSSSKMCVLLIEDIDVVFEQDEGFTAAILQIMTTSKRPIILTTTEEPSPSIQRAINHHQIISFTRLASILTIWLQIVCLVEGFYVSANSLHELLTYNKGDIRQTLLQLQLYISSGGQPDKRQTKNELEMFSYNEVKMDDDNSNLSLKCDESSECKENVQIHQDCVRTYNAVRNFKSFSLPHSNDLEQIWWNLPAMLNLPDFSKKRLERRDSDDLPKARQDNDKEALMMLSECYETLAFADVLCCKNQFHECLERRWRSKAKDGLGLEEDTTANAEDGVRDELVQTLIGGRIGMYKEKFCDFEVRLNMAVPGQAERRWRSKQLASEEKLQAALAVSESLNRKATVLDYMPCLRTITRFEFERAANNTKRGNRFYNYLRNLGVRCNDTTCKVACDVFKICD